MPMYNKYHARQLTSVLQDLQGDLSVLLPKDVSSSECAAVFDLDDTLFRVFRDKSGNVDPFAHPIRSVCAFYNECVRMGVIVFIVTARQNNKEARKDIHDAFKRTGLSEYQHLFMMRDFEAPA
eukprot:2073205-Pleurochrysis_carterae.AAC.1